MLSADHVINHQNEKPTAGLPFRGVLLAMRRFRCTALSSNAGLSIAMQMSFMILNTTVSQHQRNAINDVMHWEANGGRLFAAVRWRMGARAISELSKLLSCARTVYTHT